MTVSKKILQVQTDIRSELCEAIRSIIGYNIMTGVGEACYNPVHQVTDKNHRIFVAVMISMLRIKP